MHTKGPWELILNYDNNLKGSIKGRHTIKDSDGWNIARIWESAPNAEANARLIAAAPDMLEALQWYVDNDDTSYGEEDAYWEAGRDKATEAIRKAKGE